MSVPDVDAVVVGAGVAGLAAAHELRALGAEPLVLEAEETPGGVMRSERVGGHLLERGPNTMRVKAPALALLRRAGVESDLLEAAPAGRRRFILHQGELEPLPAGPWAAVRTPLLSARGKLRLLAEPLTPRGDGASETVAEFCSRRLGGEASERLVGTFLTGVYAGDERRLGAEAVFPDLVRFEREKGSIVRGALSGRRGASRGLSGMWSTPDGLAGLGRGLAAGLGDGLRLGVRVDALEREEDAWRVSFGGESVRAGAVVLAVPAEQAAALLSNADAELAKAIAGVCYAPVVSLSVSIAAGDSVAPVEGFGFLVPRAEGRRLLGCLFMSRLFPGRAPDGRHLLTCMIGGTRWPDAVDLDDGSLSELARIELDHTLGLRGDPETLALTRWQRAVPQPGRDHVARIAGARARALRLGGLGLAGSWVEGVGVTDALASGISAAGSALRGRPPSAESH